MLANKTRFSCSESGSERALDASNIEVFVKSWLFKQTVRGGTGKEQKFGWTRLKRERCGIKDLFFYFRTLGLTNEAVSKSETNYKKGVVFIQPESESTFNICEDKGSLLSWSNLGIHSFGKGRSGNVMTVLSHKNEFVIDEELELLLSMFKREVCI
ncbi:hypothetical protein BY458DRAFT_547657 [Sporodiniella umbellata]|nr:hypothetical protein BY458DRAFT_547657 [Sporodiniella umbellata]